MDYNEHTAVAPEFRPADPWLTFSAPVLSTGLAGASVDLACGAGHNSLWLARLGHQVLGVDVSDTAFSRAAAAAAALRLGARFMVWDVEADGIPPGAWGAILVFHFLDRSLLPSIPSCLAPGGLLIYKTHMRHASRGPNTKPRSPAHLLRSGELLRSLPGLVPLAYREWAVSESAYAAIVARKPSRHSR